MAQVNYPKVLDLGPWCLGTKSAQDPSKEEWRMDPARSMIAGGGWNKSSEGFQYVLRAAVCHYGRHENGHYICYREHPELQDQEAEADGKMKWWRLSDDDVSSVTEDHVLGQGGVFMLFYERIETPCTPEKVGAAEKVALEDEVTSVSDKKEAPAASTAEETDAIVASLTDTPELATAETEQPSAELESKLKSGVQPVLPAPPPASQSTQPEIPLEAQQTLSELKRIPSPATMRTARRGSKKSKGGFEAPYRVVAAT